MYISLQEFSKTYDYLKHYFPDLKLSVGSVRFGGSTEFPNNGTFYSEQCLETSEVVMKIRYRSFISDKIMEFDFNYLPIDRDKYESFLRDYQSANSVQIKVHEIKKEDLKSIIIESELRSYKDAYENLKNLNIGV